MDWRLLGACSVIFIHDEKKREGRVHHLSSFFFYSDVRNRPHSREQMLSITIYACAKCCWFSETLGSYSVHIN